MNLKKDEDIIHGLTESQWFYGILYSPDGKEDKLFLFFVIHKPLSVTFRITVSFAQPYFQASQADEQQTKLDKVLHISYIALFIFAWGIHGENPLQIEPQLAPESDRGGYTQNV